MRKLPIPGYSRYEIDEAGTVYNVRTGKPLRASVNRHGYHKVNLYVSTDEGSKEKHTKYIHKLVSEVFLGPCPEGLITLHGDGNKSNNHLRNLRYGTYKDNYWDAIRHGRKPGKGRGGGGNGRIGDWQRSKTHCPQGHEYTPENTRLSKEGWRNCRQCRKR